MRKLRWLLTILLAFSLVAAACGDDDDDGAADTGDDAGDDGDDAGDDGDDAGDDGDDAGDDGDDAGDDGDDAGDDADAPAELITGAGVDVDAKIIRIGLNTDLSGIFAPLTTKITDGQLAYWENVNANGGIEGWTIEPIVLDSGYDVPTHVENYEVFSGEGDESVVMLTTSTGSPHTAAIAEDLIEDDMFAIPLSWYSGWADPEIGKNVFEVQTNYCIEAMNGVSYLAEHFGNKIAIAGFPGDYGQDGAIGAKLAAEALGLEVVYDGEAAVVPGADQTPVVTGIVESGADFVWLTTNPGTAAELLGGAAAGGFTGMWSGNSPTWNPALLDTGVGDYADTNYIHSTYTVLWGVGDAPAMADMISVMEELRPDAPLGDEYISSWIQGRVGEQVIRGALAAGDITRAGILAIANAITVDLGGLAPDQSWGGDPNDGIVRSSYMYDVDKSVYSSGATISDGGGRGYTLLEGPFVSDTAAAWDYEPCFKAS